MTRAEQLRAHADACEIWAGHVRQFDIQEQFRQLAGQWRTMAEQIERIDSGDLDRQAAEVQSLWNAISGVP